MRAELWAAVVCAAGVALAAQGTSPAQTVPSYRAESLLVPVDVRVVDLNRKPVTDLHQSDFTVLEDGVPQTISHFVRSVPSPDGETTVGRRVFLIAFGRVNSPMTPREMRTADVGHAVDGVLHFLRERLLPLDLAAVLEWDRVTSFTTDHAHLLDIIERLKLSQAAIENLVDGVSLSAGRDLQPLVDDVFGGPRALDVHTVVPRHSQKNGFWMLDMPEMLLAAIDELSHIDGEKHLIFVSELGLAGSPENSVKVAHAAAAARVAIDFVYTGGAQSISASPLDPNVRGFPQWSNGRASSVPAPHGVPSVHTGSPDFRNQTALALASFTGGVSYWSQLGSATADLDAIDDITHDQYVLGYYPTDHKGNDDGFRNIEVRVNRPGLTVLYRHGYATTARDPVVPSGVALTNDRLRIAAAYPYAINDIPVRITAPVATRTAATVKTDFHVDPSALRFTHENGRNAAVVVVAIWYLDKKNQVVGQSQKSVPLSLTDDELRTLTGTGLPLSQNVPSTPAATRVKVVVYQYASDRTGSAIETVR